MTPGLVREDQQHRAFSQRARRPMGKTLRQQPCIATKLNLPCDGTFRGTVLFCTRAKACGCTHHFSASLWISEKFSAEHSADARAMAVSRVHVSNTTHSREVPFSMGPLNSGINSDPSRFSATIDEVKNTSRIFSYGAMKPSSAISAPSASTISSPNNFSGHDIGDPSGGPTSWPLSSRAGAGARSVLRFVGACSCVKHRRPRGSGQPKSTDQSSRPPTKWSRTSLPISQRRSGQRTPRPSSQAKSTAKCARSNAISKAPGLGQGMRSPPSSRRSCGAITCGISKSPSVSRESGHALE
jgi:hypothetical protein